MKGCAGRFFYYVGLISVIFTAACVLCGAVAVFLPKSNSQPTITPQEAKVPSIAPVINTDTSVFSADLSQINLIIQTPTRIPLPTKTPEGYVWVGYAKLVDMANNGDRSSVRIEGIVKYVLPSKEQIIIDIQDHGWILTTSKTANSFADEYVTLSGYITDHGTITINTTMSGSFAGSSTQSGVFIHNDEMHVATTDEINHMASIQALDDTSATKNSLPTNITAVSIDTTITDSPSLTDTVTMTITPTIPPCKVGYHYIPPTQQVYVPSKTPNPTITPTDTKTPRFTATYTPTPCDTVTPTDTRTPVDTWTPRPYTRVPVTLPPTLPGLQSTKPPTSAPISTAAPKPTVAGVTCPGFNYTCSQLTCAQAYACLAAGNKQLDGNHDGIPCNAQCAK